MKKYIGILALLLNMACLMGMTNNVVGQIPINPMQGSAIQTCVQQTAEGVCEVWQIQN